MLTTHSSHKTTWGLIWLSILLFWGVSWEAEFGMDAMTYAGLARRILIHQDWKTLHYSSQGYENFYQHPPLVMWLLAGVFKITGVANEWTAKILPYLFSLGTLLMTIFWGSQAAQSSWGGFLSGLILLTSTRFIKYAPSPLLDGFLAFWLILGGWLLLQSFNPKSKPWIWGPLQGVCLAGGFLTKGMPTLLLFFGLMASWITQGVVKRSRKVNLGFFLALTVLGWILSLWLYVGDGLNYLEHYWIESVQGRLGGHSGWLDWLAPMRNLFKGYWPWNLVYFYSIYVICVKQTRARNVLFEQKITSWIPLLASLGVLGGFSLSGHFLEHYLVPFYPFAAIASAVSIAQVTEQWREGVTRVFFILLIFVTLLLATFPIHTQGVDYQDPQRRLLKRAASSCHGGIRRIYLSADETSFWWGLAMGTWYTPWDTRVLNPSEIPVDERSALLLSRRRNDLAGSWVMTSLIEGDFRVYQRPNSQACPEL
ncbi:MAG: ArnT family glycosyltransferase [Bdellovibrionia bacterium]